MSRLKGTLSFPAPLWEPPTARELCYIPDPSSKGTYAFRWANTDQHQQWLTSRLVHTKESAAQLHCNAMLEVFG